ncbi:hypothetical protein A0H81_09534 [Grifola frondosa]|uniref:Uncharacterized protein n=1 Tax=Grifola frondosa TaxID=5627 RepID=A0A1C7M209_GRIFR|nr:hypothetical protein A0H81_09534 [Grifola frondosa]
MRSLRCLFTDSSSSFHRLRALVRLARASMMVRERVGSFLEPPSNMSISRSCSRLTRRVALMTSILSGRLCPRPQLTVLDVPEPSRAFGRIRVGAHTLGHALAAALNDVHACMGSALDFVLNCAGSSCGYASCFINTRRAPSVMRRRRGAGWPRHGASAVECCVFSSRDDRFDGLRLPAAIPCSFATVGACATRCGSQSADIRAQSAQSAALVPLFPSFVVVSTCWASIRPAPPRRVTTLRVLCPTHCALSAVGHAYCIRGTCDVHLVGTPTLPDWPSPHS